MIRFMRYFIPIFPVHYGDVIMGATASQINSLTIVYSTVYSDADQRKHQSSASLAFVWGIHRGPVNSPHKWPVTWKMFPFDDVIMPPIKVNNNDGWSDLNRHTYIKQRFLLSWHNKAWNHCMSFGIVHFWKYFHERQFCSLLQISLMCPS